MNVLTVPNGIVVALFGIVLSASFCDICWTKRNRIVLAAGTAAILLLQGAITFGASWDAMQELCILLRPICPLPPSSASSAEIGSGPPSRCWRHICAVSSGAGRRFWWSR